MENPYQVSGLHPVSPGAVTSGSVTPEILETLARTKPWVRFFSIMGFILIGFALFFGLVMMAGGVINTMYGINNPHATMLPIFLGFVSGIISLAYLIPSIKLWKYGSGILRTLQSGSATNLQQALEQQRGFWKHTAIIMLLTGVLLVLVILVALFMAPATPA